MLQVRRDSVSTVLALRQLAGRVVNSRNLSGNRVTQTVSVPIFRVQELNVTVNAGGE